MKRYLVNLRMCIYGLIAEYCSKKYHGKYVDLFFKDFKLSNALLIQNYKE